MKKIVFLMISITILFVYSCTKSDTLYTTSATIYLINETNEVVKSDVFSNYIIQPGDTLIHTESHTNEYDEKPSIDNYDPFALADGSRVFIYGDSSQCEYGLSEIKNYENRKEIRELEFELTFRFTEEKRDNSEPCN